MPIPESDQVPGRRGARLLILRRVRRRTHEMVHGLSAPAGPRQKLSHPQVYPRIVDLEPRGGLVSLLRLLPALFGKMRISKDQEVPDGDLHDIGIVRTGGENALEVTGGLGRPAGFAKRRP